MSETRKYKDPFLGEIELTKVGEVVTNAVGETIIERIYVHENSRNNCYYISTWATSNMSFDTGDIQEEMSYIGKDLIDKIIEYQNKKKNEKG